jgi:hypothetical protein
VAKALAYGFLDSKPVKPSLWPRQAQLFWAQPRLAYSFELSCAHHYNHHCEQLLMGWNWGATRMGMTRRGPGMTKMMRRGSRHDNDRHHPSLTPNARGGFLISFWVTTTTTTPSLTPNVRGGVSHSILSYRHHHPSLTPIVRGGFSPCSG